MKLYCAGCKKFMKTNTKCAECKTNSKISLEELIKSINECPICKNKETLHKEIYNNLDAASYVCTCCNKGLIIQLVMENDVPIDSRENLWPLLPSFRNIWNPVPSLPPAIPSAFNQINKDLSKVEKKDQSKKLSKATITLTYYPYLLQYSN